MTLNKEKSNTTERLFSRDHADCWGHSDRKGVIFREENQIAKKKKSEWQSNHWEHIRQQRKFRW